MGIVTYILRALIEKSKYPIFNVCPMYFFSDTPNKLENLNTFVVDNDFFYGQTEKSIYGIIYNSSKTLFFFYKNS